MMMHGRAESGPRLRRASAADAAALAKAAERMFRDAFAASNEPRQMDAHCAAHFGEAVQRAELEREDIRVLLMEDEQGIVAYAQLRLGSPEAEIWRFYVDSGHHGRGIARLLMDESLAAMRAAGAQRAVLAVWEHNPRAIAFYTKSGFAVTGARSFVLGDEEQRDLVMTRDL